MFLPVFSRKQKGSICQWLWKTDICYTLLSHWCPEWAEKQSVKTLALYCSYQFSSWLKNWTLIFNLFLYVFVDPRFWNLILELFSRFWLWHLCWEPTSLTGMRKIKSHNWKQEYRPWIMVQVNGKQFTQWKYSAFIPAVLPHHRTCAAGCVAFQTFLTS